MNPYRTPDRSTHYIVPLKRTRIPGNHLVLDSEATIVHRGGVFEHRFAVAAGRYVRLFGDEYMDCDDTAVWLDPGGLWADVTAEATRHGELVVWAHNLPYDLRVTDGLRHLVNQGWTLDAISIARTAGWASWRQGKAKLTVCDSFSWFHCPLDRIAHEYGLQRRKPAPGTLDPQQLAEHCHRDVEILSVAVRDTLNWLAAENLGNFRPTGSGQSHAAWRRRFMPERSVQVHDVHPVLLAERDAMHTGRTEAWRHGRIKGRLHEVDLSLAYCRIAANNDLPVALIGERANMKPNELRQTMQHTCVMATGVVETALPLVPYTHDDRVIWPTGTFTTTLWDPEIELLYAQGQRFTPTHVWLYRPGNALQAMSQWTIDQIESPQQPLPPAVRRILKHWARTLVGRMALRYRQWDYFGEHPRSDLCISYEIDPDTPEPIKHMRIGHTMLELAAMSESKSSCPMIPGWVQSRCRHILWEIIDAAGEENVFYMDTDGLLVNDTGLRRLNDGSIHERDWLLVHKATYRKVTIHGERNVETDHDHRLAGIPKNAIRLDEITWEGETWTGLEAALERGHVDYAATTPTTWTIAPTAHRRHQLEGGHTQPHHLREDQ